MLGNSRIFGYVKDGGRLVVDESKAPMVRELFELYASGEYSMKQIETLFWDKANAVLKKRSEDVKGRQGICNHANLLTGKLYCTHCGAAYYRRESVDRQGNKNSKWVCSGKIKNGADSCPSFAVYEEELKPLLFQVFRETEADAQALVEEYIEIYKSLGDGEDTARQITALRQQIDLAQRKKSKLLGYNAAGELSDRDFLSMNKECDKEIGEAERQIYELEQQQLSKEDFRRQIETIRRVLREAERDAAQGLISKEFVDKYIDKIFASPEEDGSLRLQIKIFNGESTEKCLENLRSSAMRRGRDELVLAGCAGHTFKKMIPTRSMSFERADRTAMGHQVTVTYRWQVRI